MRQNSSRIHTCACSYKREKNKIQQKQHQLNNWISVLDSLPSLLQQSNAIIDYKVKVTITSKKLKISETTKYKFYIQVNHFLQKLLTCQFKHIPSELYHSLMTYIVPNLTLLDQLEVQDADYIKALLSK